MPDHPLPVLTEGLTREFRARGGGGRRLAVDDLTLSIPEGQVMGLLGPNGAGKSTTMKLLLGLLRPTAGRARLFGRPSGDRRILERVGYLPEESKLFPWLTARETIVFFARMAGLSRRDAGPEADRLLADVGMAADAGRRVERFSKGMARRVALAVALTGAPDLLIFDEPTSGLDPLAAGEMKDRVLRLKEEGRTVLFSSHLLADVADVCDRIVVLREGRLVSDGAPGDLLRLRDEYDLRFRSGEAGFEGRVRDFVTEAGGDVVSLDPATGGLADLFRRLFENRDGNRDGERG
ncbi:MAG: ABC transporter ATP-binding protein [Planctomycetota bacterium]